MNYKKAARLILFLLFFLALLIFLAAPRFPHLIEYAYSTKIYYSTIRYLSLLTGLVPFSLAELIVILTTLFLIYQAVKTMVMFLKNKGETKQFSFRSLLRKGFRLALGLILLYLLFNLMWGLNYSRLTFAEITDLSVEPASANELGSLALYLTHRTNELRNEVTEDHRNVTTLPRGIDDMLRRAHLGYEGATEIYPELGGKYGRPKGVMLSHYWSYTGISGVYFPFTAEANVNINLPHFMLPFTTSHEMAHQRGFAREDEANYIAYLTCISHPDTDFQYSGTIFALLMTMNALQKYDVDTWREMRTSYSDGVNRDLKDWNNYIDRYQGPFRELSTRINNVYLKANRQKGGVKSYNRMVDLLLAEFRAKRQKT